MRSFLKMYEAFLIRYPYMSQMLQTGVLVATGDVIAQTLVEKQAEYDAKRTLQFFCVGAFYVGPALSVWYRVLDKYVGSGGKTVALKKVALDQLCFAPPILAGFVIIAKTLQGQTVEEVKQSLKDHYPTILINNYKVWPLAQAINFSFVPLHFQVLYVQVLAIFWNTYICYRTRPNQ